MTGQLGTEQRVSLEQVEPQQVSLGMDYIGWQLVQIQHIQYQSPEVQMELTGRLLLRIHSPVVVVVQSLGMVPIGSRLVIEYQVVLFHTFLRVLILLHGLFLRIIPFLRTKLTQSLGMGPIGLL
jgi:hypothetical protein